MAHWYTETGEPRHYEAPNGKPTTLRQARPNGWIPSVTTILGVVNAPWLNIWNMWKVALMAIRMIWQMGLDDGFRAAFRHVRRLMTDGDFAEEWLKKEVIPAHKAEVSALADQGTEIHGALEAYFTDGYDGPHLKSCEAVKAELDKHCGDQDWIAEKSFADPDSFYAGKCDLHSAEWVVDFKSKGFGPDDPDPKGWPNQAEQLAAYAYALGVPDARIANVFVSRTHPGHVSFYEHKGPVSYYFDLFMAANHRWQMQNKYGPYYERKQAGLVPVRKCRWYYEKADDEWYSDCDFGDVPFENGGDPAKCKYCPGCGGIVVPDTS